ncbi:MAG TPA: protein-disulfide reductase DsbD domain-containing protein [Pyrinomonadaceae bacterium]|jgi:DsbC/DsbD-like thiol-disulfide interchange protein
MKKILSIALFSLGLLFFAAGPANAQTVNGSIGAVARGGSVRGTVTLSIPGGLHVNSNRPNSQYAIPTNVRLTVTGAKTGAITYPRGRNRKFQFSEDTLNVYEGTVSFLFNLTVPANFKGNSVKVRAVVRFQACTEEVCYPPKTQEVTLTARVK